LLLVGYLAPWDAAHATWWNGDWSFRKEITVDAGAGGGNVTADAGRVPVLVRLHDGNFKFSDAKDDGTDIRFVASDDKTVLNSHIEYFDSILGIGLIWVDVPDVKAGATVKFTLYYGNPKAAGGDTKAAYDPDQVLVWHFTEKGSPAKDWTGYGNNATSVAGLDSAALIGTGAKLDGHTAIGVPASPSLSVAAGGAQTIAGWVKLDDPAASQVFYARGDAQSGLVIGIDQGTPYVEVTTNGAATRQAAAAKFAAGEWHQLAITAGDQIQLFVDGQPAATLPAPLPALDGPAWVGGDQRSGTVVNGLTGSIDEFGIAKTARSAGYVRALFTSESANPTLVKFGTDEANSGLSGGYIGVILRSVTIDGWVIIGILILMMLTSWLVTYNRTTHFNAVQRANEAFLQVFRKVGRNPVRFEALVHGTHGEKLSKDDFEDIEDAPMFRMTQAGLAEIHERFGGEPGHVPAFHLSAPMIHSIKASVESVLVREIQSMNKFMVVLTICISGGPFIGLLGTVVGVMITFAAIAAAGDVNVNAIAPGIAAALVATCFGLFVAIPALFAYNYLLLRVKDEVGKMNIFVEEMITRMAELFEFPESQDEAIAAE
jgi:biopolymer transport protein ExbB